MNLTALEERRSRGDLIYTYKIARVQEKINWENIKHRFTERQRAITFDSTQKVLKLKEKMTIVTSSH